MFYRHLFEMLLFEGPYLLSDQLPYPRQPVKGADDKVRRKKEKQGQKPPRMVHIHEAEPIKDRVCGGSDGLAEKLYKDLYIFFGFGVLFEHRPDHGCEGYDEKNYDCQLDGSKKVPDLIYEDRK